ncbi:MAG: hypothetical protein ACYDER_01330 [Ktedonobacteraceae bacterium]
MDPNLFWNVIWGIIGSLLGAVVVVFVQDALSRRRARSGFLTGEWEQVIYDTKGVTETRKDRVIVRHEDNVVKGHVNRLEPIDQRFKSWDLSGRIEGHMLFCTFWSTDLKKNPGSYGTVQLHMINQSRFTGFYLKLGITSKPTGFSEALIQTKLEWRRKSTK